MAQLTSFFVTLSLIFSYIFGLGSISTIGNYSLDSKKKLPSSVSLFTAQGLCCDGEYFYGSGAISALKMTCLSKFDLNMNCKKRKINAVPKEFTEKYGSSHIGGIDCANGYIYAPVEGKIDGKYKYNFILLFDCDTLEYTGIYYDLTGSALTDGIPWCAVDRENGFLYTSKFKNVDVILKYNLENMEFLGTVELQQTLNRIQGGSVYKGDLYLSYDVADSAEEQILKVEPSTGAVTLEMTRCLPNYDNEAEDICVYPLSDGTLIHTVDYDKLLNANVMHYRPDIKTDR